MTEEQIASLYSRLEQMTEDERLELEDICRVLRVYQKSNPQFIGRRVPPNLIVALAAVDIMNSYERTIWTRE